MRGFGPTSTLYNGREVVVVGDLGVVFAGLLLQLGGQRLHGPEGHGVHGVQRAVQPVQAAGHRRQHHREQAVAQLALAAAPPRLLRPRAEVLAAPPAIETRPSLSSLLVRRSCRHYRKHFCEGFTQFLVKNKTRDSLKNCFRGSTRIPSSKLDQAYEKDG